MSNLFYLVFSSISDSERTCTLLFLCKINLGIIDFTHGTPTSLVKSMSVIDITIRLLH